MIHWKIIIILLIIKILSLIIAHANTNTQANTMPYLESEQKTCITETEKNFMLTWIRYTVYTVELSKAIINKNKNESEYYNNLESTKDLLIKLFYELHKDEGDQFKDLINKQVFYKINLCKSVVDKNSQATTDYSNKLIVNTHELGKLFSKIKTDKLNALKLSSSLNSHTDKYIKSFGVINKISSDELGRELVLGSIDTAKMLFI
jgi:hypothetical protein